MHQLLFLTNIHTFRQKYKICNVKNHFLLWGFFKQTNKKEFFGGVGGRGQHRLGKKKSHFLLQFNYFTEIKKNYLIKFETSVRVSFSHRSCRYQINVMK